MSQSHGLHNELCQKIIKTLYQDIRPKLTWEYAYLQFPRALKQVTNV